MPRMRIGYGGPKDYQHGYRRPTGNLSEFERLIHLMVSLQILFGSRKGGLLIPVLLVAIGLGGWWAYKHFSGPDRLLQTADRKWDSGDTQLRIQAIRDYKILLIKKDPIDPGLHLLKDGRERLYRRIVIHHVLFDISAADANDWIRDAWDEGFRDLGFQNEKVKKRWEEVTAGLKRKLPDSSRDQSKDPDRLLQQADRKWDSGDTKKRIEAIRDYKLLLTENDPIDPDSKFLNESRKRLYRLIVSYHVLFDIDDTETNEWMRKAWEEGIRDLGFQDERINKKWKEVTAGLKDSGLDSTHGLDDASFSPSPNQPFLGGARLGLAV